MKKLIIVGALCVLSSYLYASPSLNANTYTQLQSEGTFLATQATLESYVPFQTTNATNNMAFLLKAKGTRDVGASTTLLGLSMALVGSTLLGVGISYASVDAEDRATSNTLAISGATILGFGSLALIGGAIAWGVGANQMRFASFLP